MRCFMESYLHEFMKRKTTFNRIKEWNRRADSTEDEVDRFIYRWISFNGLYSALYALTHYSQDKAEANSDLTKINDFCEKFILPNKDLETKIYSDALRKVFDVHIRERAGKIGSYLRNLDHNDIEEKTKYMILIAYKIRCRLFHGEKNPLLEVDREVVKAADQVIAPIMDWILQCKL